MSDEQWALVEPLLPPRSKDGRKPRHAYRDIVDAIMYVVRTGCAWRHLPSDFPPWQTVFGYFTTWRKAGIVRAMHDRLRDAVWDGAGRDPMVSAGIVDAQSVKGSATVGVASRGYDAGKKVNGRKRHVVVDTLGLLVVVMVTTAAVQDRDGGRRILDKAKMAMPSLAHVWADGGYAGKLVTFASTFCRIAVQIVKKPAGQNGFAPLPRRWVVERTLSWITACRRLDHDYERLPEHSEAMVHWSMIGIMLRRLAPPPGRKPWQAIPTPTKI